MFAKASQAIDPYMRETDPRGAAMGIPDALAYRIPGMSQELPQKSTIFGEPRERWGVGTTDTALGRIASAVQSMTVPYPMSMERADREVEKEFSRLGQYRGMPPSMPRRKMKMRLRGVDGTDVKLTTEEYKIYDRYHAIAKDQLANTIASPQYARMPDALKAKLLRSTYQKFRDAANRHVRQMIMRRTTVGN
jgi:hypothetical protein